MSRPRPESGSSTTEKKKSSLLLWRAVFCCVFVFLVFAVQLSPVLLSPQFNTRYSHRIDGRITSTAYRIYQSLYPRFSTRVKMVSNPKVQENWEQGDQEICGTDRQEENCITKRFEICILQQMLLERISGEGWRGGVLEMELAWGDNKPA